MSRKVATHEKLPKGWHRVRLGKVASVKTGPFGAQLHQHDYVKTDGTPIVTVEHLSENGLVHENLPLVADHDKKRLSQFLVQEGDILFSRVGSVDRSSLVSKKEDGWLFSGRLLRVRPDNKLIDSHYLKYFFSMEKFKHRMRSTAVGGTMPSLNTAILSNVKVSYPLLSLQQKIAELLSEWDTAIEKTERLIANKKKQFKWLLKTLISDQQDNPTWRKVSIDELFDIQTFASKNRFLTPDGKNIVVDMGSISKEGKLIEAKTTNYAEDFLAQGDLVMPKDDIGGGQIIGKVAVIKKDAQYVCGDHVYRLVSKTVNSPEFLRFAMNSAPIHTQLRAKANGTSQLGLGKSDVLKQKVKLPSLKEQKAIIRMLTASEYEILLLKQFTEKYRAQKRGVMQKLLTGEWTVYHNNVTEEVPKLLM